MTKSPGQGPVAGNPFLSRHRENSDFPEEGKKISKSFPKKKNLRRRRHRTHAPRAREAAQGRAFFRAPNRRSKTKHPEFALSFARESKASTRADKDTAATLRVQNRAVSDKNPRERKLSRFSDEIFPIQTYFPPSAENFDKSVSRFRLSVLWRATSCGGRAPEPIKVLQNFHNSTNNIVFRLRIY